MPWKAFDYRGQEVFVRVLPEGKPIVRRGLVEFRYKVGATKSYRTDRDNMEDAEGDILDDSEFGGKPAQAPAELREVPSVPADENTIIIHTDGACSGNPGPGGVGVHILRPDRTLEISEFMGSATNNSAELTAILRALENLSDEERASSLVHLYTDSAWSLGILTGGWKAKTNLDLIKKIKTMIDTCAKLELLKVKAHAGQAGNEEADYLATMAARREDSSTRERPRRR